MGDAGITSAQVEGFNIETNSGEAPGEITKALKDEQSTEEKPSDLSDAASELGKKGGAAAAKAKKAAKRAEAKAAKDAALEAETNDDEEGKPTTPDQDAPDDEPEAKEAKPDAEEDAPEEKDTPEKRKRDARTRVLEATRTAAEAKRDRDAARAEADRLRAEIAALKAPAKEAKPERAETPGGPGEPQEENYDNYRDFVRDLARWEIKQENENRRVQEQRQAVDKRLMDQVDKFRETVGETLDQYSPEVLNLRTEFQLQEGERPSGENWIANELFSSPESAPTLMLHMTEHPEVLQRLAALPTPRDVSREMAMIETRLEVAKTGTPDTRREEVSRAHPPVRPVTGVSGIGDADPAPKEGESFDSWYRRTKQG